MHFNFNYFIRFVLIIIISLFYLKYRNNQCIKNQNCKPYFISNFLSFKKEFSSPILVSYQLEDNLVNIDILIESSPKLEDSPRFKNLTEDTLKNYILTIDYLKTMGYADVDLVNDNDMITKKFTLRNTSKNALKVFPKMIFNEKFFKIYNCFCGSKIIVEPMSTKDIFIYFKVKDFIENDKNNNDDRSQQNELKNFSIRVSI
jgi:hypothetical protein